MLHGPHGNIYKHLGCMENWTCTQQASNFGIFTYFNVKDSKITVILAVFEKSGISCTLEKFPFLKAQYLNLFNFAHIIF